MPSTDPLDAADFNPTAHINRLFPNEESLAEVDAHVGGLQERMRELDEEVLRTDGGKPVLGQLVHTSAG